MKHLAIMLLIVGLLPGCSHLSESHDVDPAVHGAWAGEGRFYDRDLAQEYGTYPVAIEVHADDTVTGSVGAARLLEGSIVSRPEDHLVRARLTGAVFAEGSLPGEDRDCVVLILQTTDGAVTGGNIHLKTNFTFDFAMRVGEVALSRAP